MQGTAVPAAAPERVFVRQCLAAGSSHMPDDSTFLLHCSTAYHMHPPLERIFTLSAEEVDMAAVLQLEDVLLAHLVTGQRHRVAQQRQAGQGRRLLEGLVEEE